MSKRYVSQGLAAAMSGLWGVIADIFGPRPTYSDPHPYLSRILKTRNPKEQKAGKGTKALKRHSEKARNKKKAKRSKKNRS
jgi:rRNA processing protein Gar1